jgi:hypothetical protein
LAVGPLKARLGQTVIGVEPGTGDLVGRAPERLNKFDALFDQAGGRGDISGRCEVHAVVGEHSVDLVGNGFDQTVEEVASDGAHGLLVQFDEGQLRSPVNSQEHAE